MARIVKRDEARRLALPGRTAHEIVSGTDGARGLTLRRVEIPVPAPGEPPRAPHRHADFEECIHVLAGRGMAVCDGREVEVRPGDTIVVSPGEWHATRNVGSEPLVLLCFFPVADVRAVTEERGTGAP